MSGFLQFEYSFALLYSLEELVEPSLTVKVTGNQWYWSYEYSNCKNPDIAEHIDGKKFDSYMIPTEDLEEGNLRLLEVDNRLLLPVKTHISVIVTAADVLHCWAVPSLGVKMDACPGRINQASVFIKRDGVFYGQCRELCGINHGFMPIVVEAVPKYEWMVKMYVTNILDILEDVPDFELEGFENIAKS
jgi:cytochrome c oxidase subunit 2